MKVKDSDYVSFNDLLSKELDNPEFKNDFENEYLKIKIINEIVAVRKQNDMTQKEMADIVGIPQGNISRFESGKIVPTLDFIQNLATKLGYSINISLEKIK